MSDDFPLIRRQIEAQITDLAQAITDYGLFMRQWRAKRDGYDPETGEIIEPSKPETPLVAEW